MIVSGSTSVTRYAKNSEGDFMFYDLRENFGSVLVQNGVSTAVTQKLLAHSSSDLIKQGLYEY